MRYREVVGLSARHTLRARGEWIARSVFYVILLLVFSRLWRVVGDGGVPGVSTVEFVWYLALTEWVVLATPMFYLGIEEEVRRGDIAYLIARPVSYLSMKVAEGLGLVWARLVVLGVVGFVFAWTCGGGLPEDPRGLLLAVPLGILSCAVLVLFQVAIGLSVFWLQDGSPVYWIYQKLNFVFGGLFWPLDIYPAWLRDIALWTPFSAMVYGVGRSAFAFDPGLAVVTALQLLAWGAAVYLFVVWLYGKAVRVVNINGG
jgi:ABC-2 type transport system permease protein